MIKDSPVMFHRLRKISDNIRKKIVNLFLRHLFKKRCKSDESLSHPFDDKSKALINLIFEANKLHK